MDQNIVLTIVELVLSIIIEGVILSMVFQFISTKAQEKQQQNLKEEMNNIEKQNKFDYQQLQAEIRQARMDIINEIKEGNML
jgi:Na+-translocating ferredoxin:NAD+ oxidoreductase RnfG subunit